MSPEPAAATPSLPTTSPSLGRVGVELVLVAAFVLFQELLLIRWIPGQVRVVAYFPNLILLAAFLGVGIGCLRATRASLLWTWPLALLAIALASWALGRVRFTHLGASEHLWLLYYDLPDAPTVNTIHPPVVGLFLLAAASFVPLGQALALRLRRFREVGLPLRGYACDLLGSTAGIAVFAALSFLRTFPVVWFGVLVGAGATLFPGRRRLVPYLLVSAATIGVAAGAEKALRYSPYYALFFGPPPREAVTADRGMDAHGCIVLTNGSLHQAAMPMRRAANVTAGVRKMAGGYHMPYELLGRAPRRVLVLGAGTGNDVAVALDRGAEHVDAVEIDPVILELGREQHPDRPYADPRVTAYNTDARAFLNDTHERYDLIVFGTLDSMTHLSALANVRLDNFVYTVESLEAARRRLTPDGGVVLYFWVGEDYVDHHIQAILGRAFHELPVCLKYEGSTFNQAYLAGPAFANERRRYTEEERRRFFERFLPALTPPTDDWPYLYLREPGVSRFYLQLMGILAALCAGSALAASPELRRSLRTGEADWEMLLFGAAFLLMETRYVTSVSLVWGASWLTSAVVFASVLLTILAATLVTERFRIPFLVAFSALAVSLVAGYLLPTSALLTSHLGLRLGATLVYVGVPIFFAAVCFALRFEKRAAPDLAFGWNLLGAALGGLVEIFSMLVGLRGLFLVALAAYVLTIPASTRVNERP